MRAFAASYQNEWSKLMTRRKYYVFMGIGLLICLLWALIGNLLGNVLSQNVGAFLSLTPSPMGVLGIFLNIIIPFLLFMGVTDLITVEASEKTMKAMLLRPVERWKLFSAKLLAVLTYAALYLGSVFLLSSALQFLFGNGESAHELLRMLVSYALTFVPLAVLAAFAALIALMGKSGTLTMFILLMSYLLLRALPMFISILNEMLFTSYLSWYRVWVGALPSGSKLAQMLVIVLGFGTVFFTLGSLLFEKKEY